jgi:hypothetical protein
MPGSELLDFGRFADGELITFDEPSLSVMDNGAGYLIVLSAMLLVSVVGAFLWGFRGAIVSLATPYVFALIIALVRWPWSEPREPSFLQSLISLVVVVTLFGTPWLVAAFIGSALGIAFRSYIDRRRVAPRRSRSR